LNLCYRLASDTHTVPVSGGFKPIAPTANCFPQRNGISALVKAVMYVDKLLKLNAYRRESDVKLG